MSAAFIYSFYTNQISLLNGLLEKYNNLKYSFDPYHWSMRHEYDRYIREIEADLVRINHEFEHWQIQMDDSQEEDYRPYDD